MFFHVLLLGKVIRLFLTSCRTERILKIQR